MALEWMRSRLVEDLNTPAPLFATAAWCAGVPTVEDDSERGFLNFRHSNRSSRIRSCTDASVYQKRFEHTQALLCMLE